MPVPCDTQPVLHHSGLKTTLCGVHHQASSPELPIHQYRGIKYASIPARFRQSVLLTALPPKTDATRYGPICPQLHKKCFEEDLFGLGHAPQQILEQNEFECLNLNITCPAGLTPQSRLPVMFWIHGGGDRGYGSSWVYDGGSIVRKGMQMHKPVMVITFNFRIGLFGFAASPLIQEDNNAANDPGVGNYGLRDQRTAMQWVHQFIQEFGGDPDNVTVFGENTGASDILCHLQSVANERRPLFHRAIIQSAVIDHNIPNVGSAGWHISRVMAGLDATTVEELRAVSAEKLVKNSCGSTLRAVDDGYFFLPDWRSHFLPEDVSPSSRHHHSVLKPHDRASSRSRSRTRPHASKMHVHQPLIIGDTNSASMAWSLPASLWTSQAVVRRLNAICQSISNASLLLSSYDICSSTPDDEIVDRVLELIGDTRVSWPTECVASQALRRRAGAGVWRYVFDQDAPSRVGHKADLAYLFDNVPHPFVTPPPSGSSSAFDFCDSFDLDDDAEEHDLKFDSDGEDEWMEPPVTEWAYKRIRDTMQERWILFANGQEPWHADKVFVFGPEGEIGERSRVIFENRRRRAVWTDALEPLGMQLAQKVGMELSRGPPMKSGPMKF